MKMLVTMAEMLIWKFGRSFSCVLLCIYICTLDDTVKEMNELVIMFLEDNCRYGRNHPGQTEQ